MSFETLCSKQLCLHVLVIHTKIFGLHWSQVYFSDFDGDGYIGASDIENVVKLLTQNELTHEEIESVWEKVEYWKSLKLTF